MAYTPSCMHACMHMALLQALSILLLASMLVPGSAEEAPSGDRIELIHVDANGGFTREELIHRAVDRTHHRAAMLSATEATYSFATNFIKSSQVYLMELEIGTPKVPFWAVIDTGSDLVWTRELKKCNRIASSSFTPYVSCPDSCTPEEGAPCNCKSCTCFDELCMFKKKYGSGKSTGFMGSDTLTLSTDKAISIDFGCAINWMNSLLPESAQGIVGLNRGPMSLLNQLKVSKQFSYCLNKQKSTLLLGDQPALSAERHPTTPLVELKPSYKYYVELHEISISGGRPRSLKDVKSKHKSKNDKGVYMVVDSGSSYTILEKTVFEMLMELLTELGFNKVPKSTPKNEEKESGYDLTCYNFQKPSSQPEMELTFARSAKMSLPWANYMIIKSDSEICLAIEEGNDDQISILGNFQQQNIRMLYNLTTEGRNELSFLPSDDCQ